MSENTQYSLPLQAPTERPMQLLAPHEAFARANAALIDRFIENSSVEKKSGRIKGQILAEYFSMWANTSPEGGLMLVGVEDDGTKTGLLSLSDRQIADIELAGPNLCPDARFEQKRIKIINNKEQEDFVILFYVKFSQNRVVETHKRRAFIRRGDEKHELLDLEKMELRIDRGEIDFEDQFCGLEYPKEFRLTEIRDFADSIRESMVTGTPRTDEEVLQMRRLGRVASGQFRPNNACALLFAQDPVVKFPGCKIRFLRFDGDEEGSGAKFNATKDFWIEGTIPEIINRARVLIKAQIREYTRLGANGKFFTGPEYPEDAWYEAIVNACVHRSYNIRNSTVFVKLFDSRMEIESPGGFPSGISPENIYNHSMPRNRRLFEAMYNLKYVLCAHEGTRRMRDTMKEFGLPEPKFTQSSIDGISVRVVLENRIAFRKQYVDQRAIEVIGHEAFLSLSEKERLIVNFVAEHEKITVSDAGRIVKGGWKQVKAMLDILREKGILARISPMGVERDPKSHYVLRPIRENGGVLGKDPT